MEILLENRNYSVTINQDKTFIIDYKLIKGDKGDAGNDSPIAPHLISFAHDLIHTHINSNLLENLSFDADKGLSYNGYAAIDKLEVYPNGTEYIGTDLGYGSGLSATRLEKYENGFRIVDIRTYFDTPAYVPPDPGGGD